jgi:sec-independent protein translocase protein TatC
MSPDPKVMSFLDHLEELRRRLIKSIASILIFSIVIYFFSEQIINYVAKPVGVTYFTSPTEAFSVRIKISLILGLMVSVPVILYQLWLFVVPGLTKKEVKYVIPVVFFSTLFFFGGAVFCYFLVLPLGIKFLLGYQTERLLPLIKIGDYVTFIAWMVLAFGLVFQLPIVTFFLGKLGIVSAHSLRKGRKFAFLAILILAAVLTPSPDVFSQLMLAVPLYVLYEVSIIVVRVTNRHPSTSD